VTKKRPPGSPSEDESESALLLQLRDQATQTLDLGGLLTKDVTSSGSFDIRGGIWASTFGKLLQSLPIPAILVGQHGAVIAANQACVRITPDYERVQGQPFAQLFPKPSDANAAVSLLEEVIQTRQPKTMEGMMGIGTGKIWARLIFRSIRILDVRYVLVLAEDLTNEKKLLRVSLKYQEDLEKRVRERTSELQELNIALQKEMMGRKRTEAMLVQSERLRALGEMSAGVAHNIKNLLQMLFGLAHTAMNQLERDNVLAARKELEKVVQTLQHGTETVRRLQDFARMGDDGSTDHGVTFDLSPLITQAIDFTKPFWETYPQSKGTKVVLKTRFSEGCFVRGNQDQLFEVLVNLIKNAAESLNKGGEIDLVTSLQTGQVVFEVCDTGVGIRREDMPRLFTPFFTTKGDAGTGLGLATARSVICKHGGNIAVKSAYGKGTTFAVRLPLAPSPSEGIGTMSSRSSPRKLNILAVDDMESTLMMLKLGLEACHHNVFTARSGDEAIEKFLAEKFDLVLCDFAMPGMNGWEVERRIADLCQRHQIPRPVFILLTAWTRQSVEKSKPPTSAVDTVIEKPVDIQELIEEIAKLTGQSFPG
jgi:signal transduction histidine kinase